MNPVTRGTATALNYLRRREDGLAVERVPKDVAEAVLARADRHCECCGLPSRILVIHHRRLRSQGGKHTAANCIALRPSHHSWAHLHPGQAHELGLILTHGEPDSRPVRLRRAD